MVPKSLVGPPALTEIGGTYPVTSFPSGTSNTQLAYVTVNRTGYWAFSYALGVTSDSDHLVLYAQYAGATQFSLDVNPQAVHGGGLGGVAYIANGQQISILGTHSYNGGYNISYQTLKCWFVPTTSYPS